MSDLGDVETSLVGLIASALYPNGTAQSSAVGVDCRVYRGWPTAKALEADLRAGKINISVYPTPVERNVTRFDKRWRTPTLPAATLTATVSGNAVTIGGTVTTPQNVAVIVDGKGYAYSVQAADTLASIATALATLISASRPATSAGAVLTIPNAIRLSARVGTVATAVREVKRQKRELFVTLWCQTPALRDQVASIIDPALAAASWLSCADGTKARLLYERTFVDDGQQKEQVFRRYLVYSVEYPTTQTQQAAEVLVTRTNVTGGIDPNAAALLSVDS